MTPVEPLIAALDERLASVYEAVPELASSPIIRQILRAAYARGLTDADLRAFPFEKFGYASATRKPARENWMTVPAVPTIEELVASATPADYAGWAIPEDAEGPWGELAASLRAAGEEVARNAEQARRERDAT